ncbi:MAG: hypothetical protein R8F63_18480 [Acidimicrobiales bacterium]|nr:hypothetical protein [Acidimicrobiales bacterium]
MVAGPKQYESRGERLAAAGWHPEEEPDDDDGSSSYSIFLKSMQGERAPEPPVVSDALDDVLAAIKAGATTMKQVLAAVDASVLETAASVKTLSDNGVLIVDGDSVELAASVDADGG